MLLVVVKILRIRAVRKIANRPAIPCAAPKPFLSSCCCCHKATLCIPGIFRNDVDDAVNGIGSPERSTRPTDHLNTVNIFKHQILYIPEYSRKYWIIYRPAINHYQKLVGKLAVKSTRSYRPILRTGLRDLNTRNHSQQLRDALQPGAAYIFLGDDVKRGGDL